MSQAAADRLDTLPEGIPERTLGWEALAWAAKYLRHPDGERQGERWKFTPRQARFLLWYYAVDEKGSWLFSHAARRLSKGPIAHSEVVPTPTGWRNHGDLRVGDEVFAVDGSITKVIDLGEEVNEPCYEVKFSDGTSVRCTGSHRWPVNVLNARGGKNYSILTVDEMLEGGLREGRRFRYFMLLTPRRHDLPVGKERLIETWAYKWITDIAPVESEPARCITVGHPRHQYLVGRGCVPTCNSGKSPFAAVMAVLELLAPVRLAKLDPNVPGGCIGKPVAMPWVQVAAASAEQTKNTMIYVRSLLAPANAPELHKDYNVDVGKEKVFVEPMGTLEVITSSASSAEGSRATFIIADELEHWLPSNGGVDLFRTLKANLSKTGSRMVETLNSWIPDAGSAGEDTFKTWCEIEDGVRRRSGQGILYDAVQAPPGVDLADEDALRSALEFVYADCPWSLKVLDAIISDIYTSRDPAEARRKYLNQNVAPDDAWLDPQKWAEAAREDRVVSSDEEVVLFFDGSLSRDATALVGCCMSDGHVFTVGVWDPGNSHDKKSKRVDPRTVDNAVARAFDRYNVIAFFADVREWEGFVHHVWPDRYKDRLRVWAQPRGDLPAPIAWDMRSKLKDFVLAVELTEAEVEQKQFTHDGNAMLANHVRNARRYDTRWGTSIAKQTKNSAQKIDAAVAMVGARHVYRLVKESGANSMTYEAFFA